MFLFLMSACFVAMPSPSPLPIRRQDAAKMVKHMRYCTNMEKGDPNMADIANNCKKEVRHEIYFVKAPRHSGSSRPSDPIDYHRREGTASLAAL